MSGDFSVDRHVPAGDGIIRSRRSRMTEEGMENINEYGRCGSCRFVFKEASNYFVCVQGELLCAECRMSYEGQTYCRRHLIELVATKPEMMVLFGIALGLRRNRIKKVALLSEGEYQQAMQKLEELDYCRRTGFGLFGGYRITPDAPELIFTLIAAFGKDADVRMLLKKLDEEIPDWRQKTGLR